MQIEVEKGKTSFYHHLLSKDFYHQKFTELGELGDFDCFLKHSKSKIRILTEVLRFFVKKNYCWNSEQKHQ